jgi:hypothetical protein
MTPIQTVVQTNLRVARKQGAKKPKQTKTHHPVKVHELQRRTLHFQMFPTAPHKGKIQLDDTGGKPVYL